MPRIANKTDTEQIALIHRLARSEAMPWLPVIHTLEEEFGFFSENVLPLEEVLVVEGKVGIAGFIAFRDGWLNHLYIHPNYWGKGFGSVLLAEAKASSPLLQLWTFQRNDVARAFYSTHRFEEVELTDGARNEERTPDVKMVWDSNVK